MKTSQKEIDTTLKMAKSPEEATQLLNILTQKPFITTAKNTEDIAKFEENIGKSWKLGMNSGRDAPLRTVQMMEGMVKENVMNYVTKLDKDTRTELGKIVADTLQHNLGAPIQDRIMPEQLAQNMSRVLDGNISRSRMIARTETMRASNLASWSQNRAEGSTHFMVDNRAESCELCADEYEGEVFTIDQLDMLPPLHPNCACVPVYFTDETEAQDWSNQLSDEKVEEREQLDEKGYTIPSDGTGPIQSES
jgi:hypothetical protein